MTLAHLARDVERRAARVGLEAANVEFVRARGTDMGAALLAAEDAFDKLDAAFHDLTRKVAEITGDSPYTEQSRAAQAVAKLASEQYGEALVARMRAWRKTGRSQATRENGGANDTI
jgi:hypothetical protein